MRVWLLSLATLLTLGIGCSTYRNGYSGTTLSSKDNWVVILNQFSDSTEQRVSIPSSCNSESRLLMTCPDQYTIITERGEIEVSPQGITVYGVYNSKESIYMHWMLVHQNGRVKFRLGFH
jgi:hypothetical protein